MRPGQVWMDPTYRNVAHTYGNANSWGQSSITSRGFMFAIWPGLKSRSRCRGTQSKLPAEVKANSSHVEKNSSSPAQDWAFACSPNWDLTGEEAVLQVRGTYQIDIFICRCRMCWGSRGEGVLSGSVWKLGHNIFPRREMIFQSLYSSTSICSNSWKIKALQLAVEVSVLQEREGARWWEDHLFLLPWHGRCVLKDPVWVSHSSLPTPNPCTGQCRAWDPAGDGVM